jgi:hypothetical protein
MERVKTRHSLAVGLALLGTAIETGHRHHLGLANTDQNAMGTP